MAAGLPLPTTEDDPLPNPVTAASAQTGRSAALPEARSTPPISWPVIACVSSGEANDNLRRSEPSRTG